MLQQQGPWVLRCICCDLVTMSPWFGVLAALPCGTHQHAQLDWCSSSPMIDHLTPQPASQQGCRWHPAAVTTHLALPDVLLVPFSTPQLPGPTAKPALTASMLMGETIKWVQLLSYITQNLKCAIETAHKLQAWVSLSLSSFTALSECNGIVRKYFDVCPTSFPFWETVELEPQLMPWRTCFLSPFKYHHIHHKNEHWGPCTVRPMGSEIHTLV